MITKTDNLKVKMINYLAEYLGVEPADIHDDDSLVHDLHMKPSDLTDFTNILDQNGMDTSKIDLTEIDTVSELAEELGYEEF